MKKIGLSILLSAAMLTSPIIGDSQSAYASTTQDSEIQEATVEDAEQMESVQTKEPKDEAVTEELPDTVETNEKENAEAIEHDNKELVEENYQTNEKVEINEDQDAVTEDEDAEDETTIGDQAETEKTSNAVKETEINEGNTEISEANNENEAAKEENNITLNTDEKNILPEETQCEISKEPVSETSELACEPELEETEVTETEVIETEEDEQPEEVIEEKQLHRAVSISLFSAKAEEKKYENGATGDHVKSLKEDLVKLGFAKWSNPTNVYGTITANVVKDFQNYYGLEETGVADEATRNKMAEVLNPPYKKGDRGEPVVKLKENLVTLGFARWSNPSQFYGDITANVVSNFQRAFGLTANGIAEQTTLETLRAAVAGEIPYEQGHVGAHVKVLKEDLVKLGFARWSNPTNVYGTITANVVKQFQDYYDLEATGVADGATRSKMAEVLNPPYKKGDRGEPVVQLKEDLVTLGFARWSNPSQFYGEITANVVSNFQRAFGLTANGVAEQKTLETLQAAIAGELPYVKGDNGNHVKSLKEDLVDLGFARWSNPTKVYGEITANVVRDFQNYYGLLATGIADEATRNKMTEVLNPPYKKGDRGKPVIQLKENLVTLGFANWSNPSQYYGNITANVVTQFQKAHGLTANGVADKKTLEALKNATATIINHTKYDLTLAEALAMQMRANPQTDKNYAYVSKNYVKNNKVTASALNVRSGPCACDSKIGQLQNGDQVKILGEYNGWYQIEYSSSTWKDAAPSDVLYYLDPNNFVNDAKLRFQFLDLSKPSNTTASVLNKYLEGKGVLEGQGKAFIDASKKHGINDLYLLSHALLETGHGKSELATGVKVNGKTVYNMFGIGANDNCALECGSQRAYDEGWFTPYDAIVGGAEFIGNSYIKAGQNTLYKMRWNPQALEDYGYATHQYATDIGWAAKQVNNMYNMYKDIGIYRLVLDIPKYKS